MRLPKTFVPNKKLDGKVERLIEKSAIKTFNPETVSLLLEEYKNIRFENQSFENLYEIGRELSKNFLYNIKDIEKVNDELIKAKSPNDGTHIPLAAIVNKIIMKNDEIKFNLDDQIISFLGVFLPRGTMFIKGSARYSLGANIYGGELIIEGNTGDWAGDNMKGGKIMIKGDAGEYLGRNMKKGEITVLGDAGGYSGYGMQGGKIIIKGDVGISTGYGMQGGEIHVDGEITNIYPDCRGKIYKKGRLLWPR